MLKVSANDAARLLAIDIAGSEDAYATLMNDAASSVGLTNTRAVNASGLDAAGQFSSARDLITLADVLSSNADFRQTVMESTARFDGHTIRNTNDLLGTYPGADGIKTGHTTDAGYCLLASATRDGRRVIVAVLGAPTDAARDQAAATLLDWAFTQDPPHGSGEVTRSEPASDVGRRRTDPRARDVRTVARVPRRAHDEREPMTSNTNRHVRRRLAVAGAVVGLAASALAASGQAGAASTATVANGTLTVSAGSGADRVALRLQAAGADPAAGRLR